MKKFLLFLFFVVLCCAGGFAGWFSYSFNAEAYRKKIKEYLSKVTGRSVEIKGGVSLTWTPFPTLIVSNLSVANQKDSKIETMFDVQTIQVEIDWSSLFKEPLVIKRVILNQPVVLLERLHQYRTNFDFPILFKPMQIEDGFTNQGNLSLSIDEIKIEQGKFIYNNAISKEQITFNAIDGSGSVSSLNGPFSFSGTFLMGEKIQKIDLQIGQVEMSQKLPITVNLTDNATKTTVKTYDGNLFQDPDKPDEWLNLSGEIESQNVSTFFKNMGIENWPEGPVAGSFTLKIMTNKTLFENVTLRYGEGDSQTSIFFEIPTKGKEAKNMPTLIVKNMNYEQWRPFLSGIFKKGFFDQTSSGFYVEVKDLRAYSDTLIQGTAEGQIDKGDITFSDFNVILPYDSSVSLKGNWSPAAKTVDSDFELKTADLRALLGWFLKKTSDFLPQEGIKNADLTGHILFNPENVSLKIASGLLDESQFSGQIDASLKEKYTIDGTLDIQKVNLDTYLKLTLQNLTKIQLPTYDASFNIQAQDVIINGHNFKKSNANFSIQDKNVFIKEFIGEKDDNSVFKIKSDLLDFGTENLKFQDFKMDFDIPNLSTIFSESSFPSLNQIAKLNGSLSYDGNLKSGHFQTEFSVNQIDCKAVGMVEQPLEKIKFSDVDVEMSAKDIQDFLNLFKPIKPYFPYLRGNMALSFKGKGDLKTMTAQDLALSIEKQVFSGEMNADLEQKAFYTDLKTPELNLNLFVPSWQKIKEISVNPQAIPEWQMKAQIEADKLLYDNRKYSAFKTRLEMKDETFLIPNLDVCTSDKTGKLTFEGKVILKNPMISEGKFSLSKIPLAVIYRGEALSIENGVLNMEGNFVASGNSWPGVMQSARGQGKLTWSEGMIRGIDMNEIAKFIEKALKQPQSSELIKSQIKHGLSNGSTHISSALGSFQLENGEFLSSEIEASVPLGKIFIRKLGFPLLTHKLNATFSLIFNAFKSFPSLDAQIQRGNMKLQSEAFEKALEQQMKSLVKQQQEQKAQQERKKAEEKQNEILSSAKKILLAAEMQTKRVQDAVALRPSPEADEQVKNISMILEDVRRLAVRSDLNAEELKMLQEKANLLDIQSQELNNFWERSEILRLREAVKKLPPLVKIRRAELIQIYMQNAQSGLVGGLVKGSQIEEKKIMDNLDALARTKDLNAAKTMIEEIKESFRKIQKALNYARKMDISGG